MSTLTAAAIGDLHARRTAKGAGYAPSLAECLAAAREGRLYDVDTASAGYDGLTIADDAESALAEWAASVSPDDTAVPARWTVERVVLRHVQLTPDGGHRAPVLATREQAVGRIEAAVARYRAAGHTELTYQDSTRDGRGPRVECSGIELPPAGTLRTWRVRNAAPRLFESPMAEVGSYDRAPGVFHGLDCETYTAATEGGTIPPDMLVTERELAAAECYAADAAGDAAALKRAQARYEQACEAEVDAETLGEAAFRAGEGYDVRRGPVWCLGWAREQSAHDARVAARTTMEDAIEGRHVGCGYADCPHCVEVRA